MTAAQRLYAALGSDVFDADGSLLAWLSGPGEVLDVLDALCRDVPATSSAGYTGGYTDGYSASESTTTDPGWSVVLDVDRCPTYALPWLGQFVGVRLAPTTPDTAMRSAIRNEQGFTRGTASAVLAAAVPYLKSGATPTLVERTSDAYHLTFTVFTSQMLGSTYADLSTSYATYTALTSAFATYADYASSSGDLTAAVTAAKPAGLLLTVNILSG